MLIPIPVSRVGTAGTFIANGVKAIQLTFLAAALGAFLVEGGNSQFTMVGSKHLFVVLGVVLAASLAFVNKPDFQKAAFGVVALSTNLLAILLCINFMFGRNTWLVAVPFMIGAEPMRLAYTAIQRVGSIELVGSAIQLEEVLSRATLDSGSYTVRYERAVACEQCQGVRSKGCLPCESSGRVLRAAFRTLQLPDDVDAVALRITGAGNEGLQGKRNGDLFVSISCEDATEDCEDETNETDEKVGDHGYDGSTIEAFSPSSR
jgi:hypothetical protein